MKALDLPPLWLVYFMAGAFAAELTLPLGGLPQMQGVGWGLIGAAIALAVWAAICFGRARTTIMPHETPTAIVTDGPYRFSRNPIYVADVMILIGWGFLLGSLWPILAAPVFGWVIQARFIEKEEAGLKEAFPAQWAEWSATTRRWL